MDLDLSRIKKVFFVGIGGVGISALAQLMISRGIEVSGVNDEDSPKTLNPLRALGAKIVYEPEFSELPESDLYVYSDAWIYRGPKILESARVTGKPILSYFETLGILSKKYKVIAVSGTHGKTTTTAMIGEMLVDAGLDPTVVVGSIVKKFGSNFRDGKSEYLVVEACEYMRHFLNFHPYISIITNIEADHLDYYKDLTDIENAFSTFVEQTSEYVVCDQNDASVTRVIAGKDKKIIDYMKYIEKVPQLSVAGIHNRKNASCALVVAEIMGINFDKAQKSLAEFSGTWKRLEMKGTTKSGVIVYDDYAHHPTEVRASLEALRETYKKGEKKITVLFQPHLYSRTKALFGDFVTAFNEADNVYLLPIFFGREDSDPTISSEILAEAISKNVAGAKSFKDFDEAEIFLKNLPLGNDDIFVTMGAGKAYEIGDKLLKS